MRVCAWEGLCQGWKQDPGLLHAVQEGKSPQYPRTQSQGSLSPLFWPYVTKLGFPQRFQIKLEWPLECRSTAARDTGWLPRGGWGHLMTLASPRGVWQRVCPGEVALVHTCRVCTSTKTNHREKPGLVTRSTSARGWTPVACTMLGSTEGRKQVRDRSSPGCLGLMVTGNGQPSGLLAEPAV